MAECEECREVGGVSGAVMGFGVWVYVVMVIGLHVAPLGGGGLDSMTLGPVRADYLLHVLLFLPWVVLKCVRLGKGSRWRVEWAGIGAGGAAAWMATGIGLAVAGEGVQYWLPYRGFNPMDMIFNGVGVVLGGVLALLGNFLAERRFHGK